ncbi:transposase [Pseudidiomarina insulisalsae]|uniref:Transposase n=1 Tax=Pseudidiomarina insulisalsae TaxID=575789 RepID=A0A432YLJ2_9GAMM|nr:transposase [Pseudidiomarina insulisalsae]RUO61810.1 transposase [Pseudidiomarina insulisalsae]
MPNRRRNDVPGVALHITQRGNNRQLMFRENEDYQRFAGMLIRYAEQYNMVVHAWMLMPNHIHLLVTPSERKMTGRMMMCTTGSYTQYYNSKYRRTGTLYEKRYFSALVDYDEYVINVYKYIEMNPVKAGLVTHPRHWHWSSYRHNAEGIFSSMLVPHLSFLKLGITLSDCRKAYRQLIAATNVDSDDYDKLREQIRDAQTHQSVFGGEEFRAAMSKQLGFEIERAEVE